MDKYKLETRILGKDGTPLEGLEIKAFDEKGLFLKSNFTEKGGIIKLECENKPKFITVIDKGKTLSVTELNYNDFNLSKNTDIIKPPDIILICFPPPARWHIMGVVKDRTSGDLLPGLRVEASDIDFAGTQVLEQALGSAVTDASGQFDIWFDTSKFEWTPPNAIEQYPDIILRVKNANVILHESKIYWNEMGTHKSRQCGWLCAHYGPNAYILEIDYITAAVNKIGPVPIDDINSFGLGNYGGINDRPFGGVVTVSGRIWGSKANKWRLSYAPGVVDSNDPRFNQIDPNLQDPFTTIAEGTNKIWDGPIKIWQTGNLQGLTTLILVVWDDQGNEFHDTQILFLNNKNISPQANINSPISGSKLIKATGTDIDIIGTASDDYILSYELLWAGCGQTELTSSGVTPAVGKYISVENGKLGTWNIAQLVSGPYVIRLGVYSKTIYNDGANSIADWTWNTVDIMS